MLINFVQCTQCKRILQPNKSLKVKRRDGDRTIPMTLCATCFSEFMKKDLKEVNITKNHIADMGLWEEGAREVDIKSFLEKWIKKTSEETK